MSRHPQAPIGQCNHRSCVSSMHPSEACGMHLSCITIFKLATRKTQILTLSTRRTPSNPGPACQVPSPATPWGVNCLPTAPVSSNISPTFSVTLPANTPSSRAQVFNAWTELNLLSDCKPSYAGCENAVLVACTHTGRWGVQELPST